MRKFVVEFEIPGTEFLFREVKISPDRATALIEAKETIWMYFSMWVDPSYFWELPSRDEIYPWVDAALNAAGFDKVPDRCPDRVDAGPGFSVAAVWVINKGKVTTMTFHNDRVEVVEGNHKNRQEYYIWRASTVE